ncbi:cadherin domain-containing protein [Sphingopyxis sp. SE2]|uniref:Ig-like domain-containing protein n=1 Tax=Sphingopyxis sp. SE2 TaxID=1586240 RepID=UPI0028C20C9F|nr:Ig-like domain-containing protein [Sphingopyxis sp. SE2]MDT7530351.1 cadherin domain-containing protein [Sphingopyxis sp. SE2]
MSDKSSFKLDARDLRALSRVSINLSSFNHLETANPVSVKLTTPFENVAKIRGLDGIYVNALRDINAIALPGNPINTTQGALRQVVMAFQSTSDRHVYVLSVGNGELLSGQPYDVNGNLDYATRAAMVSIASLQQQIRAIDPDANFVVTGGYNGGTVANLFSAVTGTPSITFSSIPIDQQLIDAANNFVSPLRVSGSLFSGTSLTLDHSIRWNYSPFDIASVTSFETLIPTRSTGIADGYDGSSGQSLFNFGANAMPFGKAIVALRFAKRAAAAAELIKFGLDEALKAGLNEVGPINVSVGTSDIDGLGEFSTPDGVLNIALLSSQGDIDNLLFQGDNLLIPFARRELFSNDLIINTVNDERFELLTGILAGEYERNNYYWLDYDISRELSAALANDPSYIDRLIAARNGFDETTSNPVFRDFVLNHSNYGRFNESLFNGILPSSLVNALKSATGNFGGTFASQFNRVLRTFVGELIRRGAEPQENDIVNLYQAFVVEFDPTDANRLGALEAGNLASAVTQKRIVDAAIDAALLRESVGARPNEPTCFPAGTQVLVGEGIAKSIEELALGDAILCYDPTDPTGPLVSGKVVGKRALQASSMLRIDDLVCTPDHQLLFADGKFRPADQAAVGDCLVQSDGGAAHVANVSPADGGGVFSISVAPFPTFVASGYRVHNEALCDFSKSIYHVSAELSIRFTQYDDGRIGIEYINPEGKVLREKIIDDKLIIERVWDEYDDFTNTETPDEAGVVRSELPIGVHKQLYQYEVDKYQSIEQFGSLGNSIGSILGSRIAGNDAALGIALSATFGTVLENLFESLRNGGAWGELPLSSLPVLDNIGTEFAGNLIGSASSYLLAQIVAAAGVDGIAGEVLQSAAGNVISTIAQNILTNAPNPFADIGPGLANAAGSFVGTKLASTIYTFDSVGGQIGSAIGSAAGSIFAGTVLKALVPKLLQALGGFGGPVGAAVGAFVGYFLGGLIGSLFGGTPRSGADTSWDDASNRFVVTNLYARKGGSKDAAEAAAGSVADMLNAVLDMTGGRLENPAAVQAGNYGMRKQDYVYRPYSTQDKGAITKRFTGADGMSGLINYGALQAMSSAQFKLLGGNVYQKRAFYNYIESISGDYTKLDMSVLTGGFATASSLQNYLYNFDLANRMASANADTVLAAELMFTLTHAQELGLRRRGASDWFGGWEYLRSAANVALADFQFKLNYSTDSKIVERIIDYGPFSLSDTIDVAGQTVISGTAATDIIKLSGNVLQSSINAVNTGLTVNATAFDGSAITIPIAALIDAGDGDDAIYASDLGDTVFGGKGQDVLYGGRLDDWLLGGSGDDTLDAGAEDGIKLGGDGNYLDGGAGNDIIRGREGSDWLEGGDGVDIITGGAGDDILSGGAGDGDDLKGGSGADQYLLRRGDGADIVEEDASGAPVPFFSGNAMFDRILGIETWKTDPGSGLAIRPDWNGSAPGVEQGTIAGGEDAVVFGAGIDIGDIRLKRSENGGMPGDDLIIEVMQTDEEGVESFSGTQLTIRGWFSNAFKRVEWLKFADGNEIRIGDIRSFIVGGFGDDLLIGTDGNDFVYGGEGNDQLLLLAGDDIGNGASGNDKVWGDEGRDLIIGGTGVDELIGGAGDDAISGDAGADDIYGGADNDVLSGGRGDGDVVIGGAGDDIFKFARGDGRDMYLDELTDHWDVVWSTSGNWNTAAGINYNTATGEVTGPGGAILRKNFGTATEPDFQWVGRFDYDSASGTLKYFNPPAGAAIAANSGSDMIEFALGINIQDVILRKVGNDLVMAISKDSAEVSDTSAVTDSITIKDWYLSPGQIETLSFYATGMLNIAPGDTNLIAGTDGVDGSLTTPLSGTVLADWITAGAGDDFVAGGSGNDIIAGNSGSDTLRGEAGDDVLYGGAGNDILEGGPGRDILIGGSGTDSASYASASGAVRVRLSFQTAITGDAAGDEYDSIENIVGGSGADNIGGDEGENEITGGAGADTLMGGASDDTYVWSATSGADTIREGAFLVEEAVTAAGVLADGYSTTWTNTWSPSTSGKYYWRLEIRGPGDELVYNYALFSYAAGTAMPAPMAWNAAGWLGGFAKTNGQQVTRDKFDTSISGGDQDTIEFTAGISLTDLTFIRASSGTPDANGADLIVRYGGSAATQITIEGHFTAYGRVETLQFHDGLSVSLASILSATSGAALSGTAESDLIVGQTGVANDLLYGGAGDDVLSGLAGDDQLYGEDGDDVLEGGAGADRLDGGGNAADGTGDTVRYVNSSAVTIDLGITTAQSGGHAQGDTLFGIENVVGSQTGGDTITGDGGANIIDGLDGDNVVDGKGGDDVLISGSGNDILRGDAGEDNISAGDGNDQLWGGADDDILVGGGGGDQLRGEGGNDQLLGGDGNDTILDGGIGDDEIYGGAGNDNLTGGDGNDRLGGGTGNDTLHGGAGDDYYFVQSNDGADVIIDAEGTNIIGFDTGIDHRQIWLTQSGSDLKIGVIGEDTVLTVSGFFAASSPSRIKSIQTSTHAIFLDHPDTLSLIAAMTAASAAVPATVPQAIADVQARYWHEGGKAKPIAPTAARTITATEDVAIVIDGNYGVVDHDNDISGYQLKSGSEPAKGVISSFDPATGALTYTPNADATGTDSFVVIVTDANGHSVELTVNVSIAAVNDAPGTISIKGGGTLTISESVPGAVVAPGTIIGEFESVDVEGDTLTYTLVGDAGGRFAINAAGQLIVADPGAINFEASASHIVRVRVTDGHGAWREQDFSIAVGDANEANALSASYGFAVSENAATGTLVGAVAATDLDQSGAFASQRYYFWDGASASAISADGRYEIDALTGQIRVHGGLNFEAASPSQLYQVVAHDNAGEPGYNQAQSAVTIAIGDVNEVPISLDWLPLVANIVERDRIGSGEARPAIALGTLSVADPDTAGFPYSTYSLAINDSRFELVGNTLWLKAGASIDFEATPSVSVEITATDQSGAPFTISRTLVLAIADRDDVLEGAAGADTLTGQAGCDLIYGYGGNDLIYGGAGNDLIEGGDGDDIIHGEGGEDQLYGGAGNDTIYSGSGSDYYPNGVISGGDGDDVIIAGSGNHLTYGDAGNDTFVIDEDGGEGVGFWDRHDGGDGIDTVRYDHFTNGGINVDLTRSYDAYYAANEPAARYMYGDMISNVENLVATNFGDMIIGSEAANAIYGLGGHDNISGGLGDDSLDGGEGNDTLSGDDGDDTLIGGAGDDIIYGGTGNDILLGGAGNDQLFAESGDDMLDGGEGNDILNGGIDNDTYIINRNSGADTIQNYDPSGEDIDVIGFQDAMGAINDQDLWFERIGNDLKISVIDTTSSVQIVNWYVDAPPASRANHKIDFIVAGTRFSRTLNIEALADLMATKSKPSTTAERDTLMADLTYRANWATHWGTNAAPALSVIATQSTGEDSAKTIVVTATDDITPNAQIQLSAQVISGTDVVTNARISFGAADANGVRSMIVNPLANASGTARIRVTATDAGGVSSTQEFDIVVSGVADTPTITQFTSVGGTSGYAGGIALNLGSSFPDLDGSETHQIWITGIPTGVSLSAGSYDSGSGAWRLTPAQLSNLKVHAPAGWSQDLNLTATARATENGQTAVSAPVNLKLVINAAPTGISVRGLGTSATPWVYEYTPTNNPTGKAVGTAAVIDPDSLDRNLLPPNLSQLPFRGWGEERLVTTTGPLGGSVQVVETGQDGNAGDPHGGGLPWLSVGAADTSKAYKFTIYFKPENNMGHSLYFGTYGNIENAWDGQPNGNPYFYYGNSSGFVQDRWYRVEGYVLPSGTALIGNETYGGVFDTVTGEKVAYTYTYRFGAGASETGARFFSFYNQGNAGYSAQWYQPTIEKLEYSYQLINNAGGRFAINSVTGLITATGANFDYEASTSHSITVRVTDSFGEYRDQTIAVGVGNLNETPNAPNSGATVLSFFDETGLGSNPANAHVGVAAFPMSDPDGTVPTLEFASGGNPNNWFYIDGNVVRFNPGLDFNFEWAKAAGYLVTDFNGDGRLDAHIANVYLQASDGALTSGVTALRVYISDVNERPNNLSLANQTLYSETIAGDTPHSGQVIANFSVSDPDQTTPSLVIVGGNQNGWFTTNGAGQLLFAGANFSADWLRAYRGTGGTDAGFYYDTDGDGYAEIRVATLTLKARDAAGAESDAFTYNVYIEDKNETPTDIWADRTLSFSENIGVGTGLAWFGGSDPDNNIASYSLINNAGGRFALRSDGLLLVGNTGLNYEAGASHSITVRVTDARGAVYDESFTVSLVNQNEPHTISNGSGSIAEGTYAPYPIFDNPDGFVNLRSAMNFSDLDDNAPMNWTFANGSSTSGIWSIEGSTGRLYLTSGSVDFEALTTYYETYYDYDPYTYEPIEYTYPVRDYSLATQNLSIKASDGVHTATGTLTVSVTDVNEHVTHSSYITGSSKGTWIKISNTEYRILANTSAVTRYITPSVYDPEGQAISYSISNLTYQKYNSVAGGSSEINASAMPIITINSAGQIGFHVPNQDWDGEWEGGLKIGGYRETTSVDANFKLNIVAGGKTTQIDMKITFVRRGSSVPPLVFDLDGDGLEITPADGSTVQFDMDGDGIRDTTGWAGADDGFLALDRNGNGLIDDISEISFVGDAEGAMSDLEGLRTYDSDGDGYFDDGDAQFASFLIWRDENHDGVSQAHEMKTLGEWGIRAINLSMTLTGNSDEGDNILFATTDYEKVDGTTGAIGDVFLSFDPSNVENVAPPIVLDFDGDGKSLTEMADNKVRFDMNGDGIADKTGWIEQGDAFLALDRNGNGKIDDIKEISFVADKEGAKTDLEGLAAFDSNADGQLNGDDARFAEFRLWFDNNGNGQTDAGELLSLAQAAVVSVSLTGVATGEQAVSGKNIVYNTGGFTRANGETGKLLDVGLGFKPLSIFPEIEFQQSAWQGKAKGYRLQASSGTVRVVPRDPKGTLSADAGQIADAATLSFGNMNISMLSAILLDLDGDGLEAKRAGKSKARFDMNGDGLRDDTGWMSGGDGMLVIDRDKDGVIYQPSEFSFLSEKEGAKNSWEGLAALDSNKDGKLDKADARFGELKVWADRNGDGISQADEIKTLADLDIAEIGLRSSATSDSVKVGRNLALSTATYKRENGTTATIGNVAFGFEPTKGSITRPAEPGQRPDILPIDAARAASNLAQAMSRFGADAAEGDLRNVPKDGMALNDWFTAAVA